jgi:GAF domain-containing protein
MESEKTSVLAGLGPPSDDAFQKLLLRFSTAASQGTDPAALIRHFCRAVREFWGLDGVYFWEFVPPNELVGTEADGNLADRFRGRRLRGDQPALAFDAIRSRKTVYLNHFDPSRSVLASEFPTAAAMAAPLIVSNEVIGAVAFLHATNPGFFTDDMAAKATILAGQLGSLLEATRLTQASREEHRRAELLAEVAHALHSVPDASAVV